jgi:hypothetical protein
MLNVEELPEELMNDQQTLFNMCGGAVYLIESVEDLDFISGAVVSARPTVENQFMTSGGWAGLNESAKGYDFAIYNADGSFVVMSTFWNDSGGNVFFIPREIADKQPNVEAAIILCNSGVYYYDHKTCDSRKVPFENAFD